VTRRFLGVLFLVLLIGYATPGRSSGGSAPGASATRADLAQMEPSAQPGERPIELERQKMRSRFRYLMLGYGLIWVSLGAYLIQMNRNVARVGHEIDELKGRLDDLQGAGRRTER
jgi:hypothetical protein